MNDFNSWSDIASEFNIKSNILHKFGLLFIIDYNIAFTTPYIPTMPSLLRNNILIPYLNINDDIISSDIGGDISDIISSDTGDVDFVSDIINDVKCDVDVVSDTFSSDIKCDVKSGIVSNIVSDIVSNIVSDIVSDVKCDTVSDSDIICDSNIISDNVSDVKCDLNLVAVSTISEGLDMNFGGAVAKFHQLVKKCHQRVKIGGGKDGAEISGFDRGNEIGVFDHGNEINVFDRGNKISGFDHGNEISVFDGGEKDGAEDEISVFDAGAETGDFDAAGAQIDVFGGGEKDGAEDEIGVFDRGNEISVFNGAENKIDVFDAARNKIGVFDAAGAETSEIDGAEDEIGVFDGAGEIDVFDSDLSFGGDAMIEGAKIGDFKIHGDRYDISGFSRGSGFILNSESVNLVDEYVSSALGVQEFGVFKNGAVIINDGIDNSKKDVIVKRSESIDSIVDKNTELGQDFNFILNSEPVGLVEEGGINGFVMESKMGLESFAGGDISGFAKEGGMDAGSLVGGTSGALSGIVVNGDRMGVVENSGGDDFVFKSDENNSFECSDGRDNILKSDSSDNAIINSDQTDFLPGSSNFILQSEPFCDINNSDLEIMDTDGFEGFGDSVLEHSKFNGSKLQYTISDYSTRRISKGRLLNDSTPKDLDYVGLHDLKLNFTDVNKLQSDSLGYRASFKELQYKEFNDLVSDSEHSDSLFHSETDDYSNCTLDTVESSFSNKRTYLDFDELPSND